MYWLTLVPAYGRDYKSQAAVKKDFEANKDFKVCDMSSPWDGAAVNKTDLLNYSDAPVNVKVRYNRLTKLMVIKL